jgi:hypothetical protein
VGIKPATTNLDGPFNVVTGEKESFKSTEVQWRITGQPDGLYQVEALLPLQFLTAVDNTGAFGFTNSAKGLPSRWQLWPNIHGSFMIQNATTKEFATVKKGLARDGEKVVMQKRVGDRDLPWQLFRLERIEALGRSFDDLPSDKVAPAIYRIMNAASRNYLCFMPAPLTLYQEAKCVPAGAATAETLWNIKASGAGYYAFHNTAGYTLGQRWPDAPGVVGDIVALHGFFDATRWKLLNFDSDNFRIVNKDTGLLLTSGASSPNGHDTVIAAADRGSVLSQQWLLIKNQPPPAAAKDDFVQLAREVRFPNGK